MEDVKFVKYEERGKGNIVAVFIDGIELRSFCLNKSSLETRVSNLKRFKQEYDETLAALKRFPDKL